MKHADPAQHSSPGTTTPPLAAIAGRRRVAKVSDWLVGPVDPTRLRWFECAFTATFLLWMGRCLITWREWMTVEGFHLSRSELHAMGYPAPWPLLDGWQVVTFGVGIVGAGILLFANRWRRTALVVLFFGALYAQRVDFMAAFTLNKLYVSVFLILAVAPGISTDPATGQRSQSAAVLWVLRWTLILQYFAAGIAKSNGDWLAGSDILWSQVQGSFRTDAAAWCVRHFPLWMWSAQQHLSLAFELCAPLLFLVRRLWPMAFLAGVGFHLVIAVMMKDLIYFSLQMLSFYLLFLPGQIDAAPAFARKFQYATPENSTPRPRR